MNTKYTFYCTYFEYGKFYKTIYEKVLKRDDYINNTLIEYLSNKIYNYYISGEIFDLVIIYKEKTDKEVSDITLIKTVEGRLIFDDDTNYQLMKIKSENYNTLKEIEKLKTEQKVLEKRNYSSIWIDPFGESYNVGFAEHNEFASKWIRENLGKEIWQQILHSYGTYFYEVLEERGWIRILGWTDPPTFVYNSINPKQKETLREYCVSNDVPYEAFPKILKT